MTKQGQTTKADEAASARDASPNEQLAALVLAALVEDDLLAPEDGARLCEGLAAGKLTTDGWKLALENQLERKEAGDGGK